MVATTGGEICMRDTDAIWVMIQMSTGHGERYRGTWL